MGLRHPASPPGLVTWDETRGKCDSVSDNGTVRKLVPVLVLVLSLGACSGGSSPDTQRYYDPTGLFSARLPAANDILVVPGQELEGSKPLLSGVLALPPEASPSPNGMGIGGGVVPNTRTDSAIYAVYAVDATGSKTLGELGSSLLGGTIEPSVVSEQDVKAGKLSGLLAVVDHKDSNDSSNNYTDASAFFLDGTTGYWIREIFASGQWESRKDTFLEIVRSFRPDVPPGVTAVPPGRPGLQVRSGIGWPLG